MVLRCDSMVMVVAMLARFLFGVMAPGCAGTRERAVAPVAGESRCLVGLRLRGLHIHHFESDDEVLGVMLLCRCDFDVSAPDCMERLVEEGRIVGGFRSAREAWHAANSMSEEHGPTLWLAARYDGAWSVTASDPPVRDVLPVDREITEQIGHSDAGVGRSSAVYLLPEPLEGRGVALAVLRPKANAIAAYWPRDLTTSILLSWEDIDRRFAAKPGWRVVRWENGRQREGTWEDLATMRSAPQTDRRSWTP